MAVQAEADDVDISIANDNAYRIQFDLGKGGGKRIGGYKHMYLLIYELGTLCMLAHDQ